jgi:hypothetical protein
MPREPTQTMTDKKTGLLRRRVSAGWLIVSIMITLMQFVYTYRPRLSIEAGVTLDDTDPLATLLRIVNTGPWHLNDLRISYDVTTSSIRNVHLQSNMMVGPGGVATGTGPIAELDRGATATRDCGIGTSSRFVHIPPYDATSLRLDIIADFRWPYIGWGDQERRHFTARQHTNGKTILVPDVER